MFGSGSSCAAAGCRSRDCAAPLGIDSRGPQHRDFIASTDDADVLLSASEAREGGQDGSSAGN